MRDQVQQVHKFRTNKKKKNTIMSANAIEELCMNGNIAENWTFWKQRFQNYTKAAEINKKNEGTQCALLLHLIGKEGHRIYNTFTFAEEEKDKLDALLKKFDNHFLPREYTTFERYKFFNMRQRDLTIDQFVTALRDQANKCKFGQLKDDLIKCILISGVNSNEIREKLLQDDDTTLEDAVRKCNAISEAKSQSSRMYNGNSASEEIHQVNHRKAPVTHYPKRNTEGYTHQSRERNKISNNRDRSKSRQRRYNAGARGKSGSRIIYNCRNCGRDHPINQCSAYGKICTNCQKFNHFANVCRFNKNVKTISKYNNNDNQLTDYQSTDLHIETVFVSNINKTNSWFATLKINNKNISFKMDTGADVNILPATQFQQLHLSKSLIKPAHSILKSYTGDTLSTLGTCFLQCYRNSVSHAIRFFVVNNNAQPILGLQTCVALNLIQKIESLEKNSVNLTQNGLEGLLEKYSQLFSGIGCLKQTHHITLRENVQPVICPIRKVPLPLIDQLKETIEDLEKKEILAKVEGPSDWVHPLVLVRKPNGKIRICMDPKYLNEAIKREYCTIETFEEIASKLVGASYFSTLDATNGFYQIPLDAPSANLCTVGTPFGRYKFLRLPYGIKSAPEVFHHCFKNIFNFEGVAVYIDDILVWGTTREEHDQRLNKVLETAMCNNIKLNREKCKIAQREIKYMGHIISGNGVRADPDKIKAICEMPAPQNKQDLQRILGVLNYVGKFLPNFSTDTTIIRELLKKNSVFKWEPEHENCLQKIKEKLTKAPILQYYDVRKPVTISVDSSMSGTGAVILQNGLPIAYASKALTEAQQRYSQLEKEMFAICFGLTRFYDYIYGKQDVTVETDHLPLLGVFKKPLNQCPARLQRMLIQCQKYDFTLRYKRGKELIIADALSRAYLSTKDESDWDNEMAAYVNLINTNTAINDKLLEKIKEETIKDTDLVKLSEVISNGWPNNSKQLDNEIKSFNKYKSELTIVNGIIYKGQTILIPKSLRKEILEKLHYNHLGLSKGLQLAKSSVFWPTMKNDLTQIIENCHICNKYSHAQRSQPLHPHEIPKIPFHKVGCDLFELQNKKYLLLVDYYTKYVELEELHHNTTSHNTIRILKNIFARHGVPNVVVTDGGPQFSSDLFKEFSNKWNFCHQITSPLYPQSNGMAERHIQTIKNMMRKVLEDHKELPLALLQYRNTPLIEGCSPAQLLMSRQLRANLPTSTKQLQPQVVNYRKFNRYIKAKQDYSKKHFNSRHGVRKLTPIKTNTPVYVQIRPGTNQWTRGTVLNQLNYRKLRVKLENGAILIRNRKFIKVNKGNASNPSHVNDNAIKNKENTTVITKKRVTFGPTSFADANIKFNPLRNLNECAEASLSNTPIPNKCENRNIQPKLVELRKTCRTIKAPERLNL